MRSLHRRKLEAAVRARDVCRAHPFEDPAHVTIMVALDDRVATAQQLALEEEMGRRASASSTRARQHLRQRLFDQFRIVHRTAQLAARNVPDLAPRLPMPASNLVAGLVVTRGWGLHGEAKANLELLAKHGFSATSLEELATLLNRYEAEVERSNGSRLGNIGARAELEKVVSEIGDLIELLHVLNVHRFRDDPKSLAIWVSARNVVRLPKPPEEPTPEGPTGNNPGKGNVA